MWQSIYPAPANSYRWPIAVYYSIALRLVDYMRNMCQLIEIYINIILFAVCNRIKLLYWVYEVKRKVKRSVTFVVNPCDAVLIEIGCGRPN
jgi:hypothetical protein